MTIKDQIYDFIKASPSPVSVSEIVSALSPVQRTYVSLTLKQLETAGKITSARSGRHIFYAINTSNLFLEENLNLKGLHEDEVWHNAIFTPPLSENSSNILYFAFTEMLNNAIDHSKSNLGYVKIWSEDNSLKFIVRDKGIGIFRNFMQQKHLKDEIIAIETLLKGKQTTSPRWHSGEGIFWTSKLADVFIISSYNFRLRLNNSIKDYSIETLNKSDSVIGTEIYFEISKNSRKSLQKLFETFSLNHKTYSFDTTIIPIKLFENGDVWISRSQAKRILSGLENYKKIILDFANINFIGQGFADEIFRVFQNEHPDIIIEPINLTKSVALMIDHVLQ